MKSPNDGRILAIIGAALSMAPSFGLILTVKGMIHAFGSIGNQGASNPDLLANDISAALTYTIIGLMAAVTGMICLAVALLGYNYRAPWFYIFLIIISIIWLLNFPIGTIAGILLLCYIIPRSKEFESPLPPPLNHES